MFHIGNNEDFEGLSPKREVRKEVLASTPISQDVQM